ncbi:hypothetical protein CSPX01_13020 [Colletotrichum filicis]|nr:hypothetical protein CSPX01_13020 [Colletotrichum filicis]
MGWQQAKLDCGHLQQKKGFTSTRRYPKIRTTPPELINFGTAGDTVGTPFSSDPAAINQAKPSPLVVPIKRDDHSPKQIG